MIEPDWAAPPAVRAFVTTRDFGDLKEPAVRQRLSTHLPAEPVWLKQVHGTRVMEFPQTGEADAIVAHRAGAVCAVQIADCMPVLFADDSGTVVAAAHAGWRGLSAGVLEATIRAMGVPANRLHAWLGPAIGPRVYEVGDEVRAAFRGHESAFQPTRPGHWLLDLYAVARTKLQGLKAVAGGGFCTYTESARFFSYRRERTSARMAACIWLAE